jgi:hypothetical protein
VTRAGEAASHVAAHPAQSNHSEREIHAMDPLLSDDAPDGHLTGRSAQGNS